MINLVIMARFLKPICTDRYAVSDNFLEGIIAMPARRALKKENINSLEKLSDYSENEILQLHGFGKNAIEKLKNYMAENDVFFKTQN
jgi:hypothetical protein